MRSDPVTTPSLHHSTTPSPGATTMHRSLSTDDEPMAEMNLIPLIDIALTLVIILMVTTAFIRHPGVSLRLPETATREGAPETKRDYTVVIASDGRLFVDG